MNSEKTELRRGVGLKQYTALKIGGRAQRFFIIHSPESACRVVSDFGPALYILGGGSNLLVRDSLIRKPVVKLGEEFSYLKRRGGGLDLGASTPLSFLVKYCINNNLSGLENLAGIPATLGGLLAMNAASFGRSISDRLREVVTVDKNGDIRILQKKEIVFGYRFSSLKDYFILAAKFSLNPAGKIKSKVGDFLRKRFCTQEFGVATCGCIFKNPPGKQAGGLISSCGLGGLQRGGAQVSPKHANFIINRGRARYRDVDYLIRKIQDKVYKKYAVTLEEEIERWS